MRVTIVHKILGLIIVNVSVLAAVAILTHGNNAKVFYLSIVATFIVESIFTTYLIRHLINDPFKLLIHAIEKDDEKLPLLLSRNDEFGHLARTYQHMREAVRKTTVSKDEMYQILENMVSSVITVSSDMKIEMVNGATCAILGYTREELVGKPMGLIFKKEENMQRVPEHICQWVNKNGFIFGMEENYLSKFERDVPVIISASAMRDKNGQLKSIICVATDNTQRKRIENQLRQTNKELINNETKLKEAFMQVQKANQDLKQTQAQLLQTEKLASLGHLAAGIAHEINNPMYFITNNLEVLHEYMQKYLRYFAVIDRIKQAVELKEYEEADRMLQEIKSLENELQIGFISDDVHSLLKESLAGTERIRKIVADLRTFARADGDQLDYLNIEPVLDSITSIVNNEIKYKAQLVKEYGITPKVKISPQRIGQVFINLIINAAQSISDKGIITVKSYEEADHVCVAVKDTGCGIPSDVINKIFDPFFTTKPVGQGTGLGLSISYDIVKKHGGVIDVVSTVGEGTTFIVKLPKLKEEV